MAKYATYQQYKTSNVERLDALPIHWNVAPLRRLLTEPLANGLFKKREHWGSGVKIVNVYDAYVKGDVVNDESLDRVVCDDSELHKYRVAHGDFVFVRSSLKLEGVGKSASILNPTEPLVFECHLVRGRPNTNLINPAYLCYFLNSSYSRQSLVALSNQVTMATIDQEKFKSLSIAVPPTDEQQAIARFLDFKTTQIDALIAKKKTLLEKLAEKRTALISHAVTKGLDPSVPMKDSGVEWMGEIPSHWVCPPLYSRYSIELGKMLDEAKISGKFLVEYLRNIDVQWDEINTLELPVMDIRPSEYSRYLVQAGDLLVCEGGEVGRSAIVPKNVTQLGYQKALHKLRPVDVGRENSRFMFYTLFWAAQSGLFLAEGNPNTIPHLTGEKLRRYRFPCAPIEEQQLIAEWLDKQCRKIARQREAIEAVVRRLQEYRSALITNAVTGKIDVRGFQIPAPTVKELCDA